MNISFNPNSKLTFGTHFDSTAVEEISKRRQGMKGENWKARQKNYTR